MNLLPDDLLARSSANGIDIYGFTFALLVSLVIAVLIASLYQVFYEQRATGSQIHRSFLLLGPSITGLFIAIQFSLPLSLGLLGALSFVRFRTPIKEPEEIGFLMLLIASSVVCATFNFLLLLALLVIAVIGLVMQKYVSKLVGSKREDGTVIVTLKTYPLAQSPLNIDPDVEPDADPVHPSLAFQDPRIPQVLAILQTLLENGRLQNLSLGNEHQVIHYSFTQLKAKNLAPIQTQLQAIAGVQQVNIFFNRQGALP